MSRVLQFDQTTFPEEMGVVSETKEYSPRGGWTRVIICHQVM